MNLAQSQCVASLKNIFANCLTRIACAFFLLLFLLFGKPVSAQQIQTAKQNSLAQASSVRSRIIDAVEDTDRTVLKGNTYPLAVPAFDHGAAISALPMDRMLLVLKRSPEQETALQKLIEEQQEQSSPNYHKWLTPEQFGRQFGPSDGDIQIITTWLGSKGFQVAKIGDGRNVIEFSGTAAQVQGAFHTEIHKFVVNSEDRWANISDPQIPAALAPVVHGVLSLHNFPRKPMSHRVGAFSNSSIAGEAVPFFTGVNGQFFAVGPSDFAKIYNVQDLWNAGVDGSGQAIAVVGESNINIQDVRNFRSLFGLPQNDPQIIITGPDPGIVNHDLEAEANLDIQWAGAVAKNATIKFVIAESTFTTAGVDLAALYIIDNNIAPILSESFGACEAALGSAGNAFFNALWQQAAAQGITVILSSGDGGSAGCDNFNTAVAAKFGIAVSGLASTPYNIAVGGTDFDDVGRQSDFWDPTNAPGTRASAKSYIPEVPWNNSCAASGISGCSTPNNIVAGSGGPSKIYRRPSWQSGVNLPDGMRDLPDVSLFASSGSASLSFYVFCQADLIPPGRAPNCNAAGGSFSFSGAGGTSVSAPAFAGIIALVNQKTRTRQGNANFSLYKLAAQPGKSCNSSDPATITNPACIFYDVTRGNISVPCIASSPDCGSTGVLVDPLNASIQAWTAGQGYDLATGLGTVNAFNLVNNWSSVTFFASATTLNSLAPTTITHGGGVNVIITVSSPAGTPTGRVVLIGGPNGGTLGIDGSPLVGGTASFTTNLLPGSIAGAPYNVSAHYDGDGIFGASDSAPVSVTVSPEASKTRLNFVTFDQAGPHPDATAAAFGSPYILRATVSNANPVTTSCMPNPLGQLGCPTGTIVLTDNGLPLDGGTFALNSLGFLEDQPIQLPAGSHTLLGQYSGDNSFRASVSAPITVAISKAVTGTKVSASPTTVAVNAPLTLSAIVDTQSNAVTMPPTGTVQFLKDGALLATGTLVGSVRPRGGAAQSTASVTTTIPQQGTYSITAQYGGDSNYSGSNASATSVQVLAASTTTITSSNPTAPQGTDVTFTARVAPNSPMPTGTIQFAIDGANRGNPVTLANSQAQFSLNSLSVGVHTISGAYSGDSSYGASSGQLSQTIVPGPDFTLNSNPMTNPVTAGASATYVISATAQNGFSGSINLSCSVQPPPGVVPPSPPTCSFSNATIVPGGSPSSSTMTVGTTSRSTSLPLAPERQWPRPAPWVIIGVALLATWVYYGSGKRRRSLAGATLAALVLFLILEAVGCGGGSTSPPPPPPQGTTAGQYTVTASGSSGSVGPRNVVVTLNVN